MKKKKYDEESDIDYWDNTDYNYCGYDHNDYKDGYNYDDYKDYTGGYGYDYSGDYNVKSDEERKQFVSTKQKKELVEDDRAKQVEVKMLKIQEETRTLIEEKDTLHNEIQEATRTIIEEEATLYKKIQEATRTLIEEKATLYNKIKEETRTLKEEKATLLEELASLKEDEGGGTTRLKDTESNMEGVELKEELEKQETRTLIKERAILYKRIQEKTRTLIKEKATLYKKIQEETRTLMKEKATLIEELAILKEDEGEGTTKLKDAESYMEVVELKERLEKLEGELKGEKDLLVEQHAKTEEAKERASELQCQLNGLRGATSVEDSALTEAEVANLKDEVETVQKEKKELKVMLDEAEEQINQLETQREEVGKAGKERVTTCGKMDHGEIRIGGPNSRVSSALILTSILWLTLTVGMTGMVVMGCSWCKVMNSELEGMRLVIGSREPTGAMVGLAEWNVQHQTSAELGLQDQQSITNSEKKSCHTFDNYQHRFEGATNTNYEHVSNFHNNTTNSISHIHPLRSISSPSLFKWSTSSTLSIPSSSQSSPASLQSSPSLDNSRFQDSSFKITSENYAEHSDGPSPGDSGAPGPEKQPGPTKPADRAALFFEVQPPNLTNTKIVFIHLTTSTQQMQDKTRTKEKSELNGTVNSYGTILDHLIARMVKHCCIQSALSLLDGKHLSDPPENTKIIAAQCREGRKRINPASFVHFMPQETTVGKEVEADRLRKKQDVKSKTATKMANFKTVCSYFRDQLNNVINMLMSTKLSFCRKGYPNRIIYNDFHTRYVILAPKESVATMKKMKRPVTEEKKNIAATHAVMDKINLVGDKFQ